MECSNHPNREATNICSICGKPICPECSMEIAGQQYCKECVNEIVTKSILEKAMANTKDINTDMAKPNQEEIVESEQESQDIKPIPEVSEPITPIHKEPKAEEHVESNKKAAENYEPEYDYETAYVETYDDEEEDTYYENPEIIPEPEPEYQKVGPKRSLKSNIKPEQDYPQENVIRTNDYPSNNPSNELEAKYERYLEDLYYDEPQMENYTQTNNQAPITSPHQQTEEMPQNYENINYRRDNYENNYYENGGEYYINPRTQQDRYDEYIIPAHSEGDSETESYEKLKRRIERNYAIEQSEKQKGLFKKSRKSRKHRDPGNIDNLENIQEIHSFPEDETEKITPTEIVLAIILIILIIVLILYIIYLFRLNGEYFTFLESIQGLIRNPSMYISNVMN